MKSTIVVLLMVVGAMVALPAAGYAQEAVLSGTVTDTTGGVLPGVMITALHEATGNTFLAVTDGRGNFRLPVRIGNYRITGELAGFTTVARSLEVLVGQTAVVNLQMVLLGVQESVTVSGTAPLVETTTSTLGANIDPRRMQEIPLQGRNWMDLALLAPGSRQNASSGVPEQRQGFSQLSVDGQQVTHLIAGTSGDQPKYSRDAIAEFVISTNLFDATQGRSAGFLVNAVTKSGTNTPSGTFSGYFRSDRFNAADFIQKRVLPYSNQQLSGTFGGPIRRDRIHYFGNYEYEREPNTVTYSSRFPSFNIDQRNTRREQKGLGRVDVQFTPQTRLAVRGQRYDQIFPSGGGATSHPSSANRVQRSSAQVAGTLTKVISNRAVNEIRSGYASFDWINDALARYKGECNPFPEQRVRCGGTPVIQLVGYTIGNSNGQHLIQETSSVRNDFTISFSKRGRHDVKLGGEYLYNKVKMWWCARCTGSINAQAGPIPANIEQLFPIWNDWSTWNLAALSPITRRYEQSVSTTNFRYYPLTQMVAGWLQDDWHVASRLTLNLGLRYDLQTGALNEKLKLEPWLAGDVPYDTNNFAPRVGFAFTVAERTVLRGGYGKFFTQSSTDEAHQTLVLTVAELAQVENDGRPDFAANPYNGPTPTVEQVRATACDINPGPRCVRRGTTSGEINLPWPNTTFAHQASIGVQQQIGTTMSAEADYVFTGGRNEESSYNINLTYNPATGANYPFTNISQRAFPQWGYVQGAIFEDWSNLHALQTAFTKRMSNHWQLSGTYSFGFLRDGDPVPYQFSLVDNGRRLAREKLSFAVAPDIGGEYGLAAGDQRHRAVFNGIAEVGYGFQLSGVYFFGSGQRYSTSYGGDRRDAVDVSGTLGRLRPDGTIVPRNNLVGSPIHRVDLRIQRRIQLGGNRSVDGMLEVFNLFNHANYGSYTTQESNAAYGKPSFNNNIAYAPRTLQLGFRVAF